MPISAEHVGRRYPPTQPYEVSAAKVSEFARRGFRSLGVAVKEGGGDWKLLGMLPMFDPPREDTASTIAEAAMSSSGSRGGGTAAFDCANQPGGLGGESLATAQQLPNRGVRRRFEERLLLGAKPLPFGLVARLEHGGRRMTHAADVTPIRSA